MMLTLMLLLMLSPFLMVETAWPAENSQQEKSPPEKSPPEKSPQDKLHLHTVLHRALESHPGLLSQTALVNSYEQKVLATRGAFDPEFRSTANMAGHSYYDGDWMQVGVYQALPFAEVKTYAGYRISGGNFPTYEGGIPTLDGGEIFAGLEWNLLSSFATDPSRLKVLLAGQDLQTQKLKASLTALKVQESAIKAYAAWLASVANADIYAHLVDLAEERQTMLEKQIRSGDIASLYRLENQQYLMQRGNDLSWYEQEVSNTSNLLSLFLRTETGQMRLPSSAEASPQDLENWLTAPGVFPPMPETVPENHWETHPVLAALLTRIRALELQNEVAEVDRYPDLVIKATAKRDLGNGPNSLAGNDFDLGAQLRYPLGARTARGKLGSNEWELRALEQTYRWERDQMERAYERIRQQWNTMQRIARNTAREFALAEELEKAEYRRWREGDSELLAVNIRENATAKAASNHIKAIWDLWKIRAEWLTLTMQFVVESPVLTD